MKTIFTYIFLCIGYFVYSQNETKDIRYNFSEKSRNNLIKANFLFLAIPSISVQYERKVTKKSALAISVNYTGEQKIPFLGIINKRLGNHQFTKDQLRNVRYNSQSISPEFRFYLGKEAFKGFYIGPFLRYAYYDVKFPLDYKIDEINYHYDKIHFKGNLKALTGGVSFGAQWEVFNNLYLDWLIIGPHIGVSKEYLHANRSLTERQQSAINESLSIIKNNLQTINKIPGLNIPNEDFDYEVNNNGAKIKFNEQWAGIKMFIGIGYHF